MSGAARIRQYFEKDSARHLRAGHCIVSSPPTWRRPVVRSNLGRCNPGWSKIRRPRALFRRSIPRPDPDASVLPLSVAPEMRNERGLQVCMDTTRAFSLCMDNITGLIHVS